MGLIDGLFGAGRPGSNAVDQHGTGETMASAAKANMKGRMSAKNHQTFNMGEIDMADNGPRSDAQILLNDAANEAGYQSGLY